MSRAHSLDDFAVKLKKSLSAAVADFALGESREGFLSAASPISSYVQERVAVATVATDTDVEDEEPVEAAPAGVVVEEGGGADAVQPAAANTARPRRTATAPAVPAAAVPAAAGALPADVPKSRSGSRKKQKVQGEEGEEVEAVLEPVPKGRPKLEGLAVLQRTVDRLTSENVRLRKDLSRVTDAHTALEQVHGAEVNKLEKKAEQLEKDKVAAQTELIKLQATSTLEKELMMSGPGGGMAQRRAGRLPPDDSPLLPKR